MIWFEVYGLPLDTQTTDSKSNIMVRTCCFWGVPEKQSHAHIIHCIE